MRPTTAAVISRIVAFAAVSYAVGAILYIGFNPDLFQWDFAVYYKAFGALQSDQNPYELLYVYPPVTLWVFAPFTLFTPLMASAIFLILKSLALACLLYIWSKEFLPHGADMLLPLFLLFGYNATIYADFAAGNISVFEQLVQWTAFLFLLKNRIRTFCALIILAASFKLTPLLFLLLLPLLKVEKGWSHVLASITIFVGIHLFSAILSPTLFSQFASNISVDGGRGAINPSVFAFVSNIVEYSHRSMSLQIPSFVPIVLYAAVAGGVLAVARRPLAILVRSQDRLNLIFFVCVLMALILPRFKDYSYILLLVPTYTIILRSSVPGNRMLLLVLAMLSVDVPMPGFSFISKLWGYYPLFFAAGVFLLYVREIQSLESGAPET